MIIRNPDEYELLGFEVNGGKRYKYNAVLINKQSNRIKRIPFGGKYPDGTPYEHYQDQVMGAYSRWDHNDERRRERYRARHNGENTHNTHTCHLFTSRCV
eukprot:55372-Eustigmatos_ZCMA.PRE.1